MIIKIYSTQTCPYCVMAKEYFKAANLPFEDINVSSDEKMIEEMVAKSGQMGVPVIDIDGNIIVGFNKEAIEKALNK